MCEVQGIYEGRL